MFSPRFTQTLTDQRPRFNALFAEARHYRPRLEGAAFLDLLRRTVAPIWRRWKMSPRRRPPQ